jgi:4-amino-4-deoxy-L-arabinose transferase-like glycosyltransferase
LLPALSLGLILVLALALRLRDLHLAYGSLSGDEARLTLVARGILEHGWPLLPSGHVYTRGLVQAYLTAPSLAIFGPGDLAPRLPSVLSGVLLVAVMYGYGTSLAGRVGGLLAAALAATYEPFVFWSRQAWFYAAFVLLWVLALYYFDRATTTGSRRALLLGACALVLGLFTHELTILLLPYVALSLIGWLRARPGPPTRVRAALAAAALIGVGLALFASLTLRLRSDTLAGSLGEIEEYVGRTSDIDGLDFYRRMLTDQYGLLVLVGAAGLCLADSAGRRRLLVLLVAMIPLFVVVGAVLRPPPLERYGLALMPSLFLLAAAGVGGLAGRLRRWLPGPLVLLAAAALSLLMLWPQLDLPGTLRRTSIWKQSGQWIGELRANGYQPGDLVLTDISTEVFLYLGRTDFWLRSRGFEKYTYAPDGVRRDIHTGAPLVKSVEDFERLVRAPNAGPPLAVAIGDRPGLA